MSSSPHNMRIPDELWKLVVAEADSRAEYIKAVDTSYARYPRTRIVIDALIARYRDKLPNGYVSIAELPTALAVPAEIPPWGQGPIETGDALRIPPDPGNTRLT
jgi:hypothetical protein